jgi:glucokinase
VLTELVGDELDNVRSRHLQEAYRGGDSVVCEVLDKGMEKLGVAVASVCACVDVECAVFGGGVMEALGEELLPHVAKGFETNLFGLSGEEVSLRLSQLGDDAVPMGAAAAALRHLERGGGSS